MIVESQVGSKGELFLPKKLRDAAGINPGDKIFFELGDKGTIIVNKIPDLLELLKHPAIGKSVTPDEIERDIEQIQKDQIELSEKDEP